MTPAELEIAVLQAIDRMRTMGSPEDDRIEFKRQWPVDKGRQLAGAANRANGNPLIYVIGVDEKTGTVHNTSGTDPAEWCADTCSRFDQVAPDLIRHQNVFIGDGESVTALLFATDRAPYVVNLANAGLSEREVPIRDGTRTRSARRDEIVRLLIPTIMVPPAVPLSARVDATWNPASADGEMGLPASPEHVAISGSVQIFVEHVGPRGVMLPAHEMECQLLAADMVPLDFNVYVLGPITSGSECPGFGIATRGDGVVVTGPGMFAVSLRAASLDIGSWSGREKVELKLGLGVTGTTQKMVIGIPMRICHDERAPSSARTKELARWEYERQS